MTLYTQEILLYWRDIVEVLFFSGLFYQSALWLKKDLSKNLLPYFYGLISLIITTYILNLATISYLLLMSWPALAMLFILIHQKTLQHNFIALKNISYSSNISSPWLETIMAYCLHALNNNKPIYFIIENTDSINDFIQSPLTINAPITKELFDLIQTSTSFDTQKMVWINHNGILKGINCTWQSSCNNQNTIHHEWFNEIIVHTKNIDTYLFFADLNTYTFTFISKNTIQSNLTAHRLLELLKKEYKTVSLPTPSPLISERKLYDTHYQKPSHKQSTP